MKRVLLYHLPLFIAILLTLFLTAVDANLLPAFRTERFFGWEVVVWMPLVGALFVTQILLWLTWLIVIGRFASIRAKAQRLGVMVSLAPLVLWGIFATWVVWSELTH